VALIPLGILLFALNEVLNVFGEPIQFLYAAGISLVVSVVFLVVISLLGEAPPREKTDDLTWQPYIWREETEELRGKPLWKNYRFLSIVLLISTAIIVYIFR
nr:sodium:solute symporter [Rubrobacter sp.]